MIQNKILTIFKFYLLFLLALVFFSCSDERGDSISNPDLKNIKLNPIDSSGAFIEDIIDSIYYIRLKSNKNFKMQRIVNFFLTDSLIIVSDHLQNSVFIYDRNGNPKTKINHQGIKEGEYLTMTDVVFDEKKKLIEITDLNSKKILRYSLTGKFINSLSIIEQRYWGLAFAKNKDMYVAQLFYDNKERRVLALYKESGEVVVYKSQQLIMPSIIKDLDIRFTNQFANYKDSLFFFPLLDNKIYNVSFDGVKPMYQIEVPKENAITRDIFEQKATKDHVEYWRKMKSYNVIYNNCSLLINDKHVTFGYDFGSIANTRTIFYSKKTGKVLQYTHLKSKENKNVNIHSKIIGERNNFFAIDIHSSEFNNLPLSTKDTINSNNDHILMFFKLKNF